MRNAIVLTAIASLFAIEARSLIHTRLVTQEHVNYDSLRIVLETMLAEDQNIRRILIDSVGLDSPEAPKYFQKMAEIDFRNKREMEVILQKYGWLEKSKIGDKAAEGIF